MRREVAEMIENVVQIITGFDCSIAPVKLQIGYVTENNICKDGLLIIDAPAIVVDHLVGQGYHCSMKNGALFVDTYKAYDL